MSSVESKLPSYLQWNKVKRRDEKPEILKEKDAGPLGFHVHAEQRTLTINNLTKDDSAEYILIHAWSHRDLSGLFGVTLFVTGNTSAWIYIRSITLQYGAYKWSNGGALPEMFFCTVFSKVEFILNSPQHNSLPRINAGDARFWKRHAEGWYLMHCNFEGPVCEKSRFLSFIHNFSNEDVLGWRPPVPSVRIWHAQKSTFLTIGTF